MLEYQFRPLVGWPGKLRSSRRSATFRSGYSDTLQLLERELEYLRARHIVIQAAFSERDIRLDGMIRADARQPRHPGIILAFSSPKGSMQFPCDSFSDWQDNLRAIALSLEALRKVDRYGVTRSDEQYRGWKQLPAPLVTPPPPMTPEQAAALLLSESGLSGPGTPSGRTIVADAETARRVYRAAAARTHPDRSSGNEARFKQVQEARAVLSIG